MLAAHTRCCLLMARPTPMQVLLSTSVPAPTASGAPPALPTPCAMALCIPLFAVLSACAASVAHVYAVLADQRTVFKSTGHTDHVGTWSCQQPQLAGTCRCSGCTHRAQVCPACPYPSRRSLLRDSEFLDKQNLRNIVSFESDGVMITSVTIMSLSAACPCLQVLCWHVVLPPSSTVNQQQGSCAQPEAS